jgi:formamidopyrimidine-DNA glycosylase
MPELVEVESYRELAETALRRSIRSVHSPDEWYLKAGTSGPALRGALVGGRFVAARRTGKLLLLDADGGATLGLHFGMGGRLVVDGRATIDRLVYTTAREHPVHDRFGVCFDDGGSLVVRDPRRLGAVLLDPDETRLGPDAASIGVAGLRDVLRGSTVALKARLMDQSRLAGVGNLIADELLWRASLDPRRPAASLGQPEIRRLHRHLRATINDLTVRGGSHTGDLMEHRRPGGRCPRDGAELERAAVGGRTTWWCPLHQR